MWAALLGRTMERSPVQAGRRRPPSAVRETPAIAVLSPSAPRGLAEASPVPMTELSPTHLQSRMSTVRRAPEPSTTATRPPSAGLAAQTHGKKQNHFPPVTVAPPPRQPLIFAGWAAANPA